MNDENEWEELIDRQLRGELSESEKERLAERLDTDAEARREFVEHAQWDTRFAESLRERRERIVEDRAVAVLPERVLALSGRTLTTTISRTLLATAVATIVALAVGLYFERANSKRQIAQITQSASAEHWIARITGRSGSLVWIGDGGQIARDLRVGTELSGGTIEGMAPSSWFELEFKDSSSVMISGNSLLTFSDHGQKKLHLKEGAFSANVKPQPQGKPMLLHTRTATLEVMGTQFNVDTGLFSTTLDVSEGKVRIERLSDGSKVDVPAGYRVVTSPDQEMSLVPVPDSISGWSSQLHMGADGARGKWSPGTDEEGAQLGTVPFITEAGKTIYTASLQVSSGDNPPVVLQADSRIRVRGRITSAHEVYFGMTVRQANGDFAGRFQATRPADEFQSGQGFEVILPLDDYRLDPSLNPIKSRLPDVPFGLVVESIWCHTLFEPAGLEIIEVELIPPSRSQVAIERNTYGLALNR